MPLPKFKTQADVPEAFRADYVERNGEWVLDDSGYQTKNSQLLDEKKRAQKELDDLKAALGGATPEEIAKARADRTKAEEEAARKAGDFDKLLEKRVNETKAEYDKRIAALESYKTKYEDRELEFAIRDAATKGGVLAADIPFVLDIVKGRRVKFDEKSGKPVVVDKDGDVTGLTVDKFFTETFKAEAPKFYGAEGGSGGGGKEGSKQGSVPGGAVALTDQSGFIANLDKIAAGQVKVAL